MKVLLTGATGLVGRHVLRALRARSIEVHALARRSAPLAGATFHQVDLLSPGAAAALVAAERPTHLIHAAWAMEPGRVWWDKENLAWVGATLELARAFREAGGRRMLAVGTCAEYDWSGPTGTCAEDGTALAAATLYGACKNAAHLALRSYAGHEGLELCWARLFNLYGPHEDERRLVAGATAALLSGRAFPSSDGRQRRDFLHVRDAADALVHLALGTVQGAVNVASGRAVPVAEVLAGIAAETGRPDLLRLGALPRVPGEPEVLAADTARLRATGWRPRLELRAGLAQTVDWWRAERGHDGFGTRPGNTQ